MTFSGFNQRLLTHSFSLKIDSLLCDFSLKCYDPIIIWVHIFWKCSTWGWCFGRVHLFSLEILLCRMMSSLTNSELGFSYPILLALTLLSSPSQLCRYWCLSHSGMNFSICYGSFVFNPFMMDPNTIPY